MVESRAVYRSLGLHLILFVTGVRQQVMEMFVHLPDFIFNSHTRALKYSVTPAERCLEQILCSLL